MEKKRGGYRPGAGRPKGAKDKKPRSEPTRARMLTMSVASWDAADAQMAADGMGRQAFFEAAVAEYIKNKKL